MRQTLLIMLLATAASAQTLAPTPPMGWNSWDSYGTTLTEAQFKANADVLASALLPFGYNLATVDIEWYTPHPPDRGPYIPDQTNVTLDPFGRFLPAPNRFPSAVGAAGFKPLADYAHARGLKFGIHIMRGIPREAVTRNLPIEGSKAHAADIADKPHSATWTGMTDTYGIDMTRPGAQEYYDSIVRLYASWGVDYIKADDMSAPFHAPEIDALHAAIAKVKRPIILSLSPGPAPLAQRTQLATDAQLWRISGDFWDRWPDIQKHFELMQAWQPYVPSGNVQQGHWPDADMLPLGHLAIHGEVGNERESRLSHEEQRTLINLWAIFRSPLIMGGDLPSLLTEPKHWTLSLLTNRRVLDLDQHSRNNKCIKLDSLTAIWTAEPDPSLKLPPGSVYLAVFNRSETKLRTDTPWSSFGLTGKSYTTLDLWSGGRIEGQNTLAVELGTHESALLLLTPAPPAAKSTCWQNMSCPKNP